MVPTEQLALPAQTQSGRWKPTLPHVNWKISRVRPASRNTHLSFSLCSCSGREAEGPGASLGLPSKDSVSLRTTQSSRWRITNSLTLGNNGPTQLEPSCPHCSQSWTNQTDKLRDHRLLPQTIHEVIQFPWAGGEGNLIPTCSSPCLLPQRTCR